MYMHNSAVKAFRSVYNESSVPEQVQHNGSSQEASARSTRRLNIFKYYHKRIASTFY